MDNEISAIATTTPSSPADYFKSTLEDAAAREEKAQWRFDALGAGRLGSFAALVVSLYLWGTFQNSLLGILGLLGGVAFLFFMKRQSAARRERDFLRNLQTINQDELARLALKFTRPDAGDHFRDAAHAYTTDLDIFGKHSLYQLLNRTRTDEGSRRLAAWLRQPAALDEILLRQETVAELRPQTEWRQMWEATALLHEHAGQQVSALRGWAAETMDPSLQKTLRWRWLPILTILLAILAGFDVLPAWPFWVSLVAHALLLKSYNASVKALTERTTALGHTLSAYAELLRLAGDAPFTSRWWKMRAGLVGAAPNRFHKLGVWFTRLDYRLHPLFTLLVGIPFLWDLHCLAALEQWKKAHGDELAAWLDALADVEAINSLAGVAFAQPDYAMPHAAWEEGIRIEAEALGHPLIPLNQRVSNDFSLVGTGQTMLVTGSNMSGKSTFLRTVGLNLVLAQMGSVVCARRLVCAPVQVFTSMRTQDSLEENTSSFYAELKRLRQLLELAAGSTPARPVFYLLDEILKGTNSADRHRGAEALIRQLHPQPASGMVSTHDLELGQWGAEKPYVENFHFRSEMQDGRLHFDYKLHEGICRSFNASELMRMMGIEIEAD